MSRTLSASARVGDITYIFFNIYDTTTIDVVQWHGEHTDPKGSRVTIGGKEVESVPGPIASVVGRSNVIHLFYVGKGNKLMEAVLKGADQDGAVWTDGDLYEQKKITVTEDTYLSASIQAKNQDPEVFYQDRDDKKHVGHAFINDGGWATQNIMHTNHM